MVFDKIFPPKTVLVFYEICYAMQRKGFQNNLIEASFNEFYNEFGDEGRVGAHTSLLNRSRFTVQYVTTCIAFCNALVQEVR
jgi:hypothetical protein